MPARGCNDIAPAYIQIRIQTLTSGLEGLFGLVCPTNEAHELAHDVAVKVGRSEGVFCNRPPGREDHQVCHSSAWYMQCL